MRQTRRRRTSAPATGIQNLPDDVLYDIAGRLSNRDVAGVAASTRTLRQAAQARMRDTATAMAAEARRAGAEFAYAVVAYAVGVRLPLASGVFVETIPIQFLRRFDQTAVNDRDPRIPYELRGFKVKEWKYALMGAWDVVGNTDAFRRRSTRPWASAKLPGFDAHLMCWWPSIVNLPSMLPSEHHDHFNVRLYSPTNFRGIDAFNYGVEGALSVLYDTKTIVLRRPHLRPSEVTRHYPTALVGALDACFDGMHRILTRFPLQKHGWKLQITTGEVYPPMEPRVLRYETVVKRNSGNNRVRLAETIVDRAWKLFVGERKHCCRPCGS